MEAEKQIVFSEYKMCKSYTDTLMAMQIGETINLRADWGDNNALSSAASRLKSNAKMKFEIVRHPEDGYVSITRVKWTLLDGQIRQSRQVGRPLSRPRR
ncbi:hypothetical protein [uncultured Alistipes sp.]|uniref:hypothetical protein n=1 Tax=uncultured Alistipes sp. TaxID=538949 RepID=UPI00262307A1|nr:hypothetical protein [uncultured Alistipes sp.]